MSTRNPDDDAQWRPPGPNDDAEWRPPGREGAGSTDREDWSPPDRGPVMPDDVVTPGSAADESAPVGGEDLSAAVERWRRRPQPTECPSWPRRPGRC